MFEIRSERIRPLRDEKIITSWNALAISAFVKAAAAFDQPRYADCATDAANFILNKLMTADKRLMRRYCDGEAKHLAYLTDYAQTAMAMLDLFEYSHELKWFEAAVHFAEEINRLFRNDHGAYFETGEDAEKLIIRSTEGYDGVEPSGNSAAAMLFLRLHAYGFSDLLQKDAVRIMRAYLPYLEQAGVSFAAMLQAMQFHQAGAVEVVIVGDPKDDRTRSLLQVIQTGFYPNMISMFLPEGADREQYSKIPIAAGRGAVHSKPTAHICQNQTCQQPVHTAEELKQILDRF